MKSRTYSLRALALAVLALVVLTAGLGAGVLWFSPGASADLSALINLAGRQRMLAQRIALEAEGVRQGAGVAPRAMDQRESVQAFRSAYARIKDSVSRDPALLALLEQAERSGNALLDGAVADDPLPPGTLYRMAARATAAYNTLTQHLEQAAEASQTQGRLIATALIAATALAGILAVVALIWLSVQVARVRAHLLQVAQAHDLNLRLSLSTRNRDLRSVADSANTLVQAMYETVEAIVVASSDGAKQSLEVQRLSEHGQEQLAQQHEAGAQIATAITELSASTREVSESGVGAEQALHDLVSQAREVDEEACGIIEQMSELDRQIGQGVAQITEVSARTDEIAGLISVIESIAEQTNLLALNAAIEAAHAGEQGKGFAVVAEEVRALAGRTRGATDDIETMIHALRSDVSSSVQALELSAQQGCACGEAAGQINGRIKQTLSSLEQVRAQVQQIATATTQQSEATADIDARLHEVVERSGDAQQAGEAVAAAVSVMRAQSEQLLRQAARFSVQSDRALLHQARLAHLGWRQRVDEALAGKGHLGLSDLTDPDQCALGRWLKSEARHRFSAASELETPHVRLHHSLAGVAEALRRNDPREAGRHAQQLRRHSETLLALLDRLIREVDRVA